MKEILHTIIVNRSYSNDNCVYIFILCLEFCSLLGNGFFLCIFFRSSHLRENTPLKLILVLSLIDFAFAILVLPYTIFHISKFYQPENLNSFLQMTCEVPIAMQYKFNLIIVLAIALDRYQENVHQKYYKRRDHLLFFTLTIIFGILAVIVDIMLEFFSTNIFKAHWSSSNMALSFFGIIMTTIVSLKIRSSPVTTDTENNNIISDSKEEEKLRCTNCLSIKIFIADIIFIMIPCIFTGIGGIFGAESLKNITPFNVICLLLTGSVNSWLYMTHMEIRNAAKDFLCGRGLRRENSINSISNGLLFIS